MQKYEIMVIVENSLDVAAAEAHVQTSLTERIVTEFGGKICFEDFWGARGFAYRINKQTWGYYAVVQFEMLAKNAQILRHELNLDREIVRFLFTKVDSRAPEPRKYKELKAEYEAQEKAKNKEIPASVVPAVFEKKEKLTTIEVPETPKILADENFDEKLDAIIDASEKSF